MKSIVFLLVAVFALNAMETVNITGEKTAVNPVGTVTSETKECKSDNCNTVIHITSTPSKKVTVEEKSIEKPATLAPNRDIVITVTGEGVAPINTTSPAQAYALAKRAAIADAYRLLAEKVMGVNVEGQDLIKNMMVKRSTVRTQVYALVKNANIVETTFRDGLCEVEMEIRLSYKDFANR